VKGRSHTRGEKVKEGEGVKKVNMVDVLPIQE
jgi:hypothetical protein